MKHYHVVYKEQGEPYLSKGMDIQATDAIGALAQYDVKSPLDSTFIAMYCIDEVSSLLNLQKEIAAMPNPPLRNEDKYLVEE